MKANSKIGLLVPEVVLFHNPEKCKRYVKKHLEIEPELFETDGQMWYSGGLAVVLMRHVGKDETELSLLVHEAYHVAQAHMSWLREESPGEEIMSYLLQTITNGLFVAHRKWKGKHV